MVNWKLKHTFWGLFSSLIILLIGYGTITFIKFESFWAIGIGTFITLILAIIPLYVVLFGANKDELFIRGFPIPNTFKISIVTLGLIFVILNNVIPVFSDVLNYPGRNAVSLVVIALMVMISIGSRTAETIVIAASILAIVSTSYDFVVLDSSPLRKNILVGSFAILGVSLTLGKISLLNLISILKSQMGIGGRLNQ